MFKIAIAAALFCFIFSFSAGCAASAPNEVKNKTADETKEKNNDWQKLELNPKNPSIILILQNIKTKAIITVLRAPNLTVSGVSNEIAKQLRLTGTETSELKFLDDNEIISFRHTKVEDNTTMTGLITVARPRQTKPPIVFMGTWQTQFDKEMIRDYKKFVNDCLETLKMLK